jgi:CcmD family protein
MLWWVMFLVGMAGMNVLVFGQPGQSEFIPVKELPAGEQLPAARLLIAAYSFVWLAMLGYLWTIWQRLTKVEREMDELSGQIRKRRT